MTPDEKTPFAAVQAAVADRYDVTGILARDGLGTRYAGRDRSTNTPVAIRVLTAAADAPADIQTRFRRDTAGAARLSHPHIVPLLDSGIRAGVAYVVTPFIDGHSLEQRLQEHGRLSYPEATTLLRQVGSALDFAHARGVIHGRVAASDILLERATGRWLLDDLGATLADADPQTDLRALAGAVSQGLTGEPPVAADREAVTLALAAARPEIPPAVVRALTAPYAGPPDGPPLSVEEWLELIEAGGRRRPVKPWSALITLLLATAVGWWALRQRPEAVSAARRTVVVLPFFTAGDAPGIDLDSVLPRAFAWQLQMLPEYRVIGSPIVSNAIERRFGREPVSLDTLLGLARDLGANRVVAGRAMLVGDRITLNLEVRDPTSGRVTAKADTVGPVDSLHALVVALTGLAFRRSPGAFPSASLPRGLPAIAAYFQGVQDFRHAGYERAIEQFDRVIALDPGYAPAYLRRLLAVVQLLPTEAQIRAVMPGSALRERLDPVSQRLLAGYASVLNEGDLRGAATAFQLLVTQYPEAVDAWFSLGELQFHFGPLIGIPLGASKVSFQEVLARDPSYASAIGHLITLALAEKDDAAARTYMARYLDVDSTSVQAQLVGAGDTLLFEPRFTPRVLASFGRRPTEFLEDVALLASEFGRSLPERVLGRRAVDALWQRATRGQERGLAFRMLLASYLGSGAYTSAQQLIRGARAEGVPQDEIDRWLVLSGLTAIPELGDRAMQAAAARRLRNTRDDPLVARWLAARWYARWDPDRAADAAQDFRRLVRPPGEASPLELSLADDLAAWERVATGDTLAALVTWRRATQRFSVEQVPFALAGSLWPLRVSRVRFAMLTARYREALDASGTFLRIPAFVDQAAWAEVLPLRAEAALATGDTVLAINTYTDIADLLATANGQGIPIRDRALRILEELRTKTGAPGRPSALDRVSSAS